MKQRPTSLIPLMLGLMLFLAANAWATAPGKLTLNITLYVQGEVYPDNGALKGSIEKIRANTKDLLELFSDLAQIPFPSGAYIEVAPDGASVVRTKDEILVDVSQYVRWEVDEDYQPLFKGTYNPTTQEENSQLMFPMELEIEDDNGTDFSLIGIAFEKFKGSAAVVGVQDASTNVKAKVAGLGTVGGMDVLVEGKVTIKGDSVINVP